MAASSYLLCEHCERKLVYCPDDDRLCLAFCNVECIRAWLASGRALPGGGEPTP